MTSGSEISDVAPASRLGVRSSRVIMRPLSVDPLPQIRRAICEFDALRFAESEKPDSVAIYECYLSEIDDYPDLFQSEQFSEHVHMLSVNPATHAQHDKVFSADKSFDSECHSHVLGGAFLLLDHAHPAVRRWPSRMQTWAHS